MSVHSRWRGRAIAASALACAGLVGSTSAFASAARSRAAQHRGAAASASGTINWYGQTLPTSWDPIYSSAGHDVADLSLVYAALTRLDQNGIPQPALASSWTFSDHNKVLVLDLRKGIEFQDGTTFNATAVKINLERGLTATGSLVATLLAPISSIKVLSEYSIQLNLNVPAPELPLVLGGKAGMQVSPTEIAKNSTAIATAPIGAGPFRLTSYVPGGDAEFVRSPRYWDAHDIHVAKVYLSGLEPGPQVLDALESGQANVAVITPSQVAAAKSAGYNVKIIPTFTVSNIEVNNAIPPFNNRDVDDALKYAIDRAALVKSLNFGIGTPDDEPFPPGYFAYSKAAANDYTYNPTKAKQLLAEAGYTSSHPLKFTITSPQDIEGPISEALQAEFQAVGIDATITNIADNELTEAVYVKHDVGFNPNGIVGREAPISMLELLWEPDGLLNPGRDAPEPLVLALNHALQIPLTSSEFDPAIQQAVNVGVQDSPLIFLWTSPTIWAYAKNISGINSYIDYQRFEGVTVGG